MLQNNGYDGLGLAIRGDFSIAEEQFAAEGCSRGVGVSGYIRYTQDEKPLYFDHNGCKWSACVEFDGPDYIGVRLRLPSNERFNVLFTDVPMPAYTREYGVALLPKMVVQAMRKEIDGYFNGRTLEQILKKWDEDDKWMDAVRQDPDWLNG